MQLYPFNILHHSFYTLLRDTIPQQVGIYDIITNHFKTTPSYENGIIDAINSHRIHCTRLKIIRVINVSIPMKHPRHDLPWCVIKSWNTNSSRFSSTQALTSCTSSPPTLSSFWFQHYYYCFWYCYHCTKLKT